PGEDRAYSLPRPRLVAPDDRAMRERAVPCFHAVTNKAPDEARVVPAPASDEEPTDGRRLEDRGAEECAAEQRDAVQLVDPVERHTQRGGRDEDQAVNEVRLPQGEVERDAPAERVPEHPGVFDPQVRGDRRDVRGELPDA